MAHIKKKKRNSDKCYEQDKSSVIENKRVVVEWIFQIGGDTEQYVRKQEELGVFQEVEGQHAWLDVYNGGPLKSTLQHELC